MTHPLTELAQWLTTQLDWLRHQPNAAQAIRELADACRTIEHIVDRPVDRWYAGTCNVNGCPEELHPPAGAHTVRCHTCGTTHDLDHRRQIMLDAAEDEYLTAARAAHLLTTLGITTTAATIRGYAHRGRLAPHPEPDGAYPRYRLGSIRELVEAEHAEQRLATLRAAIKTAELADRRARRTKETAACSTSRTTVNCTYSSDADTGS